MSDECEYTTPEEADMITPPSERVCDMCKCHHAVITEMAMQIKAIRSALDDSDGFVLIEDRQQLQTEIDRLTEENKWMKRVIQALTPV